MLFLSSALPNLLTKLTHIDCVAVSNQLFFKAILL
jgi:hypothetical protein